MNHEPGFHLSCDEHLSKGWGPPLFSLSYVTGSHNFKVGVQLEQLVDNVYRFQNQNVNYRFNNGVPNRITMHASPALQRDRARDTGIYAQDQWTIDRLTLNLGVRFDRLYGFSPAQVAPGRTDRGRMGRRVAHQ